MRKQGVGGEALAEVGNALVLLQDTMRAEGRILSTAARQIMVDAMTRAYVLRSRAGIPFTPRWHLALHVVARSDVMGNPRSPNTFVDESWNGRLAKLAHVCHRMVWHRKVLANFRWAFSGGVAVARRRWGAMPSWED